MPDPAQQAATQLANIEATTGTSLAEFTALVAETGLEKHGQIVGYLKGEHGLTHGNANLLAHRIRDDLAGGPPPEDELLAAQYAGKKAALRPIFDELAALATALGDDVDQVVQKTGVSYRRAKQFALVQAPSARRIQLGLNLGATPNDERISEVSGMCSHRVDLTDVDEVDDTIAGWIRAAYDEAG